MKIAVIGSKGLPPRQGGIEHHCAEIYSRIVAEGHHVEVFARSSYNKMSWNSASFYNGIRVNNIPSFPMRGLDAFSNAGISSIVASLNQFDILHFHALGPAIFSWLPRLLAPKVKVVVTCHGLDWQRSKWGNISTRILKLGEKSAVLFSDELAVVSEDLKAYFCERYRRHAVYVANAPASYAPSDPDFKFGESLGLSKGKYLVFLGRLVPEKCPDLLVKAFQKLQIDGWKLVIIGGGSDASKYLKTLKNIAKPNPNIIFTGELLGSRLAEIIRGAGLFVLPSNLEGQPLALLEAMQEGIPVIASDIDIHRKILYPDKGLLFKEGSVEDCANALNWAIHSMADMQQGAVRARQYIDSAHNWDIIAKDWITIYEELLGISSVRKVPALSKL